MNKKVKKNFISNFLLNNKEKYNIYILDPAYVFVSSSIYEKLYIRSNLM